MIQVVRKLVIENAPAVQLFKASGNSVLWIRASGGGIVIGPSGASLSDGFRLGPDTGPISLDNNDELWAIATSTTLVSMLIQS